MKKLYWAVLSGNCFTKYNQALFSLLAPIWATTLFNTENTINSLMLTYSFLIVDWLARPVGAFFWGWLADYHSIPMALFSSLLGVTLATLCLGILPLLSFPKSMLFICMFVIRLFYSFFATGETTNGAILLLNHSDKNQHNWISSVYDISSTLGTLLA